MLQHVGDLSKLRDRLREVFHILNKRLNVAHRDSTLHGKNRARKALPVIVVTLAGMGFLWSGWWLWAGLIFLFGRVHAEPLDQITELDTPRRILGIIVMILLLITLSPIPLSYIM